MVSSQAGSLAADELSLLRQRVVEMNAVREDVAVRALISEARFSPQALRQTQSLAARLAQGVREVRLAAGRIDLLLQEFSPDSREGLALMSLAEALLRIPDKATRNQLIRDKVVGRDWGAHVGKSPSWLVNAATRSLLIAGYMLEGSRPLLLRKSAEAMVRRGVAYAMSQLAKQFVTGETIDEAIVFARKQEARGYRYSYDMLGESALTQADADAYFRSYQYAIERVGIAARGLGPIEGPGVSIKLTGLHPRYEPSQRVRVVQEMFPRLLILAEEAKRWNIGFHLDQEDAARFDLTLEMVERLSGARELKGWDGLGISLQAYQKRGRAVADWLVALARQHRRRLCVRLVKGAYWETDIARCRSEGTENYPVFTHKVHSDVSYLACAKTLLAASDAVYPQFATHNAFSISAVHTLAADSDYEFQCLHGMGETIYDQLIGPNTRRRACRIYAPVGPHESLLAYLVRRLLENGTNTSFVKQIADLQFSISELIEDPVECASSILCKKQLPQISPAVSAATSRIGEVAKYDVAIADSSALPEQVTVDTLTAAFTRVATESGSLRVLCLHEAVAQKTIKLLAGALHERTVGELADPAADIGPLVDAREMESFESYLASMQRQGFEIVRACLGNLPRGNFVAPSLIDLGGIQSLKVLSDRISGPHLHIVRWKTHELDWLMDLVDRKVRPAALRVHTQIDETIRRISSATHAALVCAS